MPDNPLAVALLTAVVLVVLLVGLLFILAAGNVRRVGLGLRVLLRTLTDGAFAGKMAEALVPPPPPPPPEPPRPSAEPLRLLTLLQREGRLIDFLLENVGPYADADIGAAVRKIHDDCQQVLKKHLDLVPVRPEAEGTAVEVPAGFDPSAVQVTGNVTGQPPFRGELKHPGWRVREIRLAPPPEGQDEFVLAPAVVEIP